MRTTPPFRSHIRLSDRLKPAVTALLTGLLTMGAGLAVSDAVRQGRIEPFRHSHTAYSWADQPVAFAVALFCYAAFTLFLAVGSWALARQAVRGN